MKIFVFAAILLFISGFMIVPAASGAEVFQTPPGKDIPVSTTALTPGGENLISPMVPMDISMLTTDFEGTEGAPPGFSPGYCEQNGWTAFAASTVQGQISSANPSSGDQHIRIAEDPSLGLGTSVGCFSPDIGAQTIGPTWMEVDVAISDTGGADYHIVPQAPSQGSLTARVNFEFWGNIWILDRIGGNLQFVDTGTAWNVGPYTTLRIEVNPGANTIDYYYGGALIYSSASGVFAGTTIEQVVLFHDNWNFGDVGDFDNLRVYSGSHPTSIDLVKMQSLSTDAVPFWVLFVPLAGILIPIFLIRRRKP